MHEIKHDGYRVIVRRDGKVVQLFTRRGHDWTERYPAIASAAAKLRARSFTIDGEAVVSGVDGVAVFDALRRRHKAADAMLHAFDLLELNGEDLRPLPLGERKSKLEKLLGGSSAGFAFNEHTDENGAIHWPDIPEAENFGKRRTSGLSEGHRLACKYRSGSGHTKCCVSRMAGRARNTIVGNC